MINVETKALLTEMGFAWNGGKLLNLRKKEICNFFPEIKGRMVDIRTGKVSYKTILHIGEQERVEITLTDFDMKKTDFSKISSKCIYGIDLPMAEIRRSLQYILQIQNAKLDNENILLSHLGWNLLSNGQRVYCAGEKIIADKPVQGVVIDEEIQMKYKQQISNNVHEAVFDACAKFLKMRCPTITILILVSIVACLRSLFVEADAIPHFVAYIYGASGTYKTTIAKYFSRFYGDRNSLNGLFGELESTNAALEQNINYARDVCVVIDDIAPCQKNKNTREKKERAASLIRQAASGVKKQKCVGNKVVEVSYDVILIFTAEELLDTVSVLNRTILLDSDKYKITSKMLKVMQNNQDFSILLQKKVIEWVAIRPKEVIEMISQRFNYYRKDGKCSSKNASRNRINETFEILHVAWDLLKECGKHYANMQIEELDNIVGETVGIAIDDEIKIIRQMELKNQSDSPLKLLFKIVNSSEITIAKSKNEYELLETFSSEKEVFGVWHKGALYLKDGQVVKYMEAKYKVQISKHKFRELLEKDGLLIKDKSGSTRKKLCGESFAVVDYEGLKDLCVT